MEKALATFRNGQVEFDQDVDWPEGTRLEIVPAVQSLGLPESEWPETEEEKKAWLDWLKNLEPFDMTPDERSAFENALRTSKKTQKELLRQSWRNEEGA